MDVQSTATASEREQLLLEEELLHCCRVDSEPEHEKLDTHIGPLPDPYPDVSPPYPGYPS